MSSLRVRPFVALAEAHFSAFRFAPSDARLEFHRSLLVLGGSRARSGKVCAGEPSGSLPCCFFFPWLLLNDAFFLSQMDVDSPRSLDDSDDDSMNSFIVSDSSLVEEGAGPRDVEEVGDWEMVRESIARRFSSRSF